MVALGAKKWDLFPFGNVDQPLSGSGGFGCRSLPGLGAGLLARLAVCSCSHCSRTVFLTDSRLLSETGCFFAQPKRTRCPSFFSAASASVFCFGIISQRATWLLPSIAQFSFSR